MRFADFARPYLHCVGAPATSFVLGCGGDDDDCGGCANISSAASRERVPVFFISRQKGCAPD